MDSQDDNQSKVIEQYGLGTFPELKELKELKTLCASRQPSDRPYYVLHLDDEVLLHDLFVDIVQFCGLKLHAVVDSQSALEFVKEHPSDVVLIISDFQMPDVNGFQFRQEVLKVNPSIPFAILSAFVDRDMALKGLDLKISSFLEKPVDFSKVASLLSKDGLSRLKSLREEEELRQGFLSETAELVEQAEELALGLDQDPSDSESLNLLFGIIHTIKGASSFFEPKTLYHFTHRFEDILKRLQRGEIRITQRSLSSLLRGIDQIKALLEEFKNQRFAEHNIDEMVSLLSKREDDDFSSDISNDVSNDVSSDERDPSLQDGKLAGSATQQAKRTEKENEIKVSVSLLDEFMQMSGEMTVIRNMLNKCVRSIERQYAGDKDVAMLVELLDELHKVNGSVQSKLTELRKIPVKNIIRRLPRAVRDISNSLGKQVELVVNGDELRVDTAIAEVLSNSLLHLVKNSLDHGLEAPEQRLSNGKSVAGRIEVSSCVRNNQVEVEIKDDGRGIDPDVIADKLIKNGTHTRDDIKRMSKRELFEMIFAPGFSTAKQVTDISGRGVGMSMVKSSVEAIGGSIQIDSVLKKETRFKLSLPVPKSVHITNCLFVTCGLEQFGIPEEEIVRVIQVEGEQKSELFRDLEGGRTFLMDGKLISVVRLSDVLKIQSDTLAESGDAAVCLVIVKVDESSRWVALQVDRILDVEDTVIKSVPSQINPHGVYQGATFMNDGTIGLILSASGIVSKAGCHHREEAMAAEGNASLNRETNSLVVFELYEQGLYAIEQGAIFRIEQMDPSRIAYSGATRIVPYGDKALPLVEIHLAGDSIEGESGGELDCSSMLTVLVLNLDERLVGLVVKEVLDIAEVGDLNEELAQSEIGIKGHALWGERLVNVINPELLLKLASNPKLSQEEAIGLAA